jgi:hypothetical protein
MSSPYDGVLKEFSNRGRAPPSTCAVSGATTRISTLIKDMTLARSAAQQQSVQHAPRSLRAAQVADVALDDAEIMAEVAAPCSQRCAPSETMRSAFKNS